MARSVQANGYRERNSTADRALTILGMFSDTELTISASAVADHLGVARSTAYRYLQSLVGERFLEESPWGFRLGVRVLELARLARRSSDVADIALPIMRELAARFHQTVLITRRVGTSVVCIEREESDQQRIRLSYERGSILPINAGASAHVLLAWLPESEVRTLLADQALTRFTDATLTTIDGLLEKFATIREAGFAISSGEVDLDVLGIAVPVFDNEGRVRAGLSIVAVENRVPLSQQSEMIAELQAGARSIVGATNLRD